MKLGPLRLIIYLLRSGSPFIVRPTKNHIGRFLGTLLASIGVPFLLKALTSNGLQVN